MDCARNPSPIRSPIPGRLAPSSRPLKSYNRSHMQPALRSPIPEASLAVFPVNGENSHQGLPSENPAPNQGHEVCNFTVLLGLQSTAVLNRVRPRSTGKERDAESGLDDIGARYYASNLGRFMSPDWDAKPTAVPYASFGDPQTLNLYSYVENAPLNRMDADGHVAAGANVNNWVEPCQGTWSQACLLAAHKSNLGSDSLSGIPAADEQRDEAEYDAMVQATDASVATSSAQQQNGSSKGTGFFGGLGQRFKNLFTGHGFKTNMELTPVVTHHIFFSASAEAGPLSQSVSYVPSTNNLYYSPGAGTGSGISLTAGWATDPNGFAGGPSGSVCFFYGVGGCGGISTSGDYAGQAGVGIGGWGAAAGYGVDPVQTMITGMVEGEPVDPLATNVGGIYMEDPQTWIPQN